MNILHRQICRVQLVLFCLALSACGEPTQPYPPRQAELLKISKDAQADFKAGTTGAHEEMAVMGWQKAMGEFARNSLEFTNWIAVVEHVDLRDPPLVSNTNAHIAYVRLKVDNIMLMNAYWELEAPFENAIWEGSPLYSKAIALNEGQKVIVSGRFIQNNEGSLLQYNDVSYPFDIIYRPKLVVTFTAMTPQQ